MLPRDGIPTIEIDVPEGRPYGWLERICDAAGVTHLVALLAGTDALYTPSADRPANADSLDPNDHTYEWRDCQNSVEPA